VDQLVIEEFNWRTFSVIIQTAGTFGSPQAIGDALTWLVDIFDRRDSQNAFPQFFSQFLMDQARAGSLGVNLRMYTNLAMQLLAIFRDKSVHIFPLSHTLIPMSEPAIRRFIDVANLHTKLPFTATELSKLWLVSSHKNTTCYAVGKLAFELLPILLSRIKPLESSEAHDVTVCLRTHPPFYLIKNDPLELEKAKAAQAIEEFLKVGF